MSVKKMLLLGAASVAVVGMTAAMAGGYTHEPMAADQSGYYIEGNVGNTWSDYAQNENWRSTGGVNNNDRSHSNAEGGFAGGVDAGYKINNNFAVEAGYYHLPDVNVAAAAVAPTYLTSWLLYLAGKYMVPLAWMNNTDWFFKFGAAGRQDNVSTTARVVAAGTTLAIGHGEANYVRPMFATGLDYSFSDAWAGIIQYAYFMGARNAFPLSASSNSGALGTLAANVLTVGLGYKFTL